MKIIYEYPPNYKAIVKTFDIKDKPRIVFTYGDILYVPAGPSVNIDKHLMCHEETHSRQQKYTSVETWWDMYLRDSDFRFSQELEAYRNQYRSMGELSFNARLGYLDHIAGDLSGPMYGNLLTKEQARTMITQGIIPKKPSTNTRKAKKRARQNRKKGRK